MFWVKAESVQNNTIKFIHKFKRSGKDLAQDATTRDDIQSHANNERSAAKFYQWRFQIKSHRPKIAPRG